VTAISVWDVLQRRKPGADWDVAGGIKAPDLEMAMLLARETHFRHKEAPEFAVRLRGTDEVHPAPDLTGIGGVIDRAYRRSEGYAGVGAKLKKVHALMKQRGLVIDRPRPLVGRTREDASHA
jgi:1,2-phenylacetyl-CoA epoxidase PaaB subunit